ncbi:MAG: hypothetical protein RIB67_07385 [Miltoncostaeaceae bacterium]
MRNPEESIRRIVRVMLEEAAALAESWPDDAGWLERLAGRLVALAKGSHGEGTPEDG